MPRRRSPRKSVRPRAPASQRNVTPLRPALAEHPRWARLLRIVPVTVQLLLLLTACGALWLALNWTYQVFRKPSELWFPLSAAFYKTPAQTWSQYQSLFQRYATPLITPELLAALAQVEGSGNPVVRTYWRWSFNSPPFDLYRPASSAVGMFQMTDATFHEARQYCIRDHSVLMAGPWHDLHSCWFNNLYSRIIPSHAVELAAAHLDHHVRQLMTRGKRPTPAQVRNLAAVIHLCGAGTGARYAARGFREQRGQRCGAHDVRAYVNRVNAMQRRFVVLAGGG